MNLTECIVTDELESDPAESLFDKRQRSRACRAVGGGTASTLLKTLLTCRSAGAGHQVLRHSCRFSRHC